jgi:MoaA/NifB/PqqE/SkfB family radical SAM enzyme
MGSSDLLRRRRKRPLQALQVEVTSRCTRSCAVCPRSELGGRWREGDLDEALWKVLEPDLTLAQHIHLQGWGEPLLHPALPRWARAAREAGCTVGLATNGDLLPEAMDWLKRGDLDQVAVSVAGDARINEELRDGSPLDRVLEAAGELARLARCEALNTKVQVSCLLTRPGAPSLPAVVELAAKHGVDECFVTHLDCRPARKFVELAAYCEAGLFEGVASCLDEAKKTARRLGIAYREPVRAGEEVLACALDPQRFVFIGWDGRIGPCVNLLLPVEGPVPRYSEAGETLVEPVCYGRLGEVRLSEALSAGSRRRFTAPFEERLAAERRFLSALELDGGVRALRKLDEADDSRTEALASNPLPVSCAACPKGLGW